MTLFELIVSNPLRADNLCILNYSEDQRAKVRKKGAGFEIHLEKHEVKNPHEEKPLGYRGDVSLSASAWLQFYIDFVRPMWPTDLSASDRLFLTDSGRVINVVELRSIFVNVSRRHLPEFSVLNPHIFRHIVATSWLKRHPDDFVTVALILGDRIATVMKEYSHLASSDGFSRYHGSFKNWENRLPPIMGRK